MNACVIVMVVENILLKSLKIDREYGGTAQVYPVLAIFGGVLGSGRIRHHQIQSTFQRRLAELPSFFKAARPPALVAGQPTLFAPSAAMLAGVMRSACAAILCSAAKGRQEIVIQRIIACIDSGE